MERETKLQIVEISLTVALIGILFWFHHNDGKQHKEMMGALNAIKDKKV